MGPIQELLEPPDQKRQREKEVKIAASRISEKAAVVMRRFRLRPEQPSPHIEHYASWLLISAIEQVCFEDEVTILLPWIEIPLRTQYLKKAADTLQVIVNNEGIEAPPVEQANLYAHFKDKAEQLLALYQQVGQNTITQDIIENQVNPVKEDLREAMFEFIYRHGKKEKTLVG